MAKYKIQLGTSIVTPIVGLIKSEISLNELKINKNEVEEAFIASFRHLSDPKVTGYTQFRVKGTPGFFFVFFSTSQLVHICLIDGTAGLFSTSNATTGNQTHTRFSRAS